MKRVHFEDHGQDCTWWDLHPQTGIIVACGPWGETLWVGRTVLDKVAELGPGSRPLVQYKTTTIRPDAAIRKIEDRK